MTSRNKKRLATSTESDPPKEEVVETVRTGTDMSTLPAEVILMILSNLSHGNQLWARLVCKQWNELITKDVPSSPFLNKSVVRVCVNTNNRDVILKNSVVKWRHLYLKDLRSSGQALPIIIPLRLRKHIQTVKISHAEVTWKGFQQILIQFPSLRRLKISRSEITLASMWSWKSMIDSKRQSEFETILKGLSSLALSRLRAETLHFFVCRFLAKLPVLATFELMCNECTAWFQTDSLFMFIESVGPTLKNLSMVIGNPNPRRTIQLFVWEVIQRLNESEIAKISLNLESFSLRYDGPYLDHTTEDVTTLLDFLRMNKNLKRICGLPENNLSLTTDLALEFVRELPRDLVGIDVPCTTYLWVQRDLFRLFGKLKSIQVREDMRPFLLNLEGQVLPTVHSFENCYLQSTTDMEVVVHAFPNLVKLQARINSCSTQIVQGIYQHMNLLVSLDLTFNHEIVDSDVTGISKLYLNQLQHYPAASLVAIKDDPIPEEHVAGLPLSTLRRLEKLTIRAYTMNISNVGLCFGFRFPGLKKLSLTNIGFGRNWETRITPGGLSFIADYNRSLEEVSLHNIVRGEVVRSEEVQTFRNRMDRCKSFRMKITWDPDCPQLMSYDEDGSDMSNE